MFSANIFTLYPEFFPGALGHGIYQRASEKKIWELNVRNIRDYAYDKHATVDDKPFGGGSGMVLKADVLNECLEKNSNDYKTYYLSPRGKVFNQELANEFSKLKGINLLCGHFEGVDQRVLDHRNIDEISVGDYVLSGGESAAVVVLDAVIRLLPGVLGNENSTKEESFNNHLLEYPQYTQPRKWRDLEVPEVLLSGNHGEIKDWRLNQSQSITQRLRPDLWSKYSNNNKKHQEQISTGKKITEFFPGDTIKVNVRIVEGKRQRVQAFEGVCIAKKNGGINSSFTVRKVSFGEGVERVFQLYSPNLDSVELIRSGKVRRAKLYYLRDRSGKSARINEKIKKKLGIDVAQEAPKEQIANEAINTEAEKEQTSAEAKSENPKETNLEKK